MLTITEAAWNRLSQLQAKRPNVSKMRLTHDKKGRVKFHRGFERNTDRVLTHDGSPTVLIAPEVANEISNHTLDTLETAYGRRLRLHPVHS